MYAVGMIGSYITRGVYTVSGPFHPFGGAVDIIVVEQPDGSFKSSPWYVRFGKFQGVLKAREKGINISVNGVEADFHMYLDQRGEAHFLREVEEGEEEEEGESVFYPLSSGDEMNRQSQKSTRRMKPAGCNFDSKEYNSGEKIEVSNGKIVAGTTSRGSRILGYVFGRSSVKEDVYQETDSDGVVRISSLERAEIAADLLEVQWSTNLATSKHRRVNSGNFSASDSLNGKGTKDNPTNEEQRLVGSSQNDAMKTNANHCTLAQETSSYDMEIVDSSQSGIERLEFCGSDSLDGKGDNDKLINDEQIQVGSPLDDALEAGGNQIMLAEGAGSCNVEMCDSSQSGIEKLEHSVEEAGAQMLSLHAREQILETSAISGSVLEGTREVISEISTNIDEASFQNPDNDDNATNSQIPSILEACLSKKISEEQAPAAVTCKIITAVQDGNPKVVTSDIDTTDNGNAKVIASEITTTDSQIPNILEACLKEKISEEQTPGAVTSEITIADHDGNSMVILPEIISTNGDDNAKVVTSEIATTVSPNSSILEACISEKISEEQGPGTVTSEITNTKCDGNAKVISSEITSTDHDGNTKVVASEITTTNSQFPGIPEVCLSKKIIEEQATGVVTSEIATADSQIPSMLEACPNKKIGEKQASGEIDNALPSLHTPEEENASADRFQTFICCKKTKSIAVGPDGSTEKARETLHLASSESREVHFRAETLNSTVDWLPEEAVNSQTQKNESETENKEVYDSCQQTPCPSIHGHDEVNLEVPETVSKFIPQMHSADPILDLVEEVESNHICTTSCFNNSDNQMEDEKVIKNNIIVNEQSPTESTGDSEKFHSDCSPTKEESMQESESSEEEQFLFSDLDESNICESQCESNLLDDKENHVTFSPKGIEKVSVSSNTNDESDSSDSSLDKFSQENQSDDLVNSRENMTTSPIGIPKAHSATAGDVERFVKLVPGTWSGAENLHKNNLHHPLSHSLDSNSKSLDWALHSKNKSCYKDVDTFNKNESAQGHCDNLKNDVADSTLGDQSKLVNSSGSWRLWPFGFRSSRSRETRQAMPPAVTDATHPDAENVSDTNTETNIDTDKNLPKPPRVRKKIIRANTPTSEQLASLNLTEGRNVVTFTFSTSVLGNQQVDARIYLWKWNTRIVISDVDGTITKSDVLGQFMPMVGVDWSQTGVAKLFTAIKENGYQLLFLSARSISQSYHTRQFLFNIKQDGKALPDGPVVISPDGLFPSLFREVIRRAPHEFKIACLEDISALFPSDCHPFYAGFGNRDTDEISYLKVGIPMGKIFIINPKGEIVVNRRLDTKSYTSLHALVHDMFPPMSTLEQEDFNSWNFWRLPPPGIDI